MLVWTYSMEGARSHARQCVILGDYR